MNQITSTPLQEMFKEMAKDHPKLFNIHTQEGRDFINKYHKIASEHESVLFNSITALKSIITVCPQFSNFQVIVDEYEELIK